MRTLTLAFAAALLFPALAAPQDVCPCVPLSYEWIVMPCESWNCAASATVLANGDKYVLTMPTASTDFKWLIIKRIVAGSAIVSPDAPFKLESYDGMNEAMSRYQSVDSNLQPMLLTVPDGKIIVISRASAEKKRAVGH